MAECLVFYVDDLQGTTLTGQHMTWMIFLSLMAVKRMWENKQDLVKELR